MSLLSGDWLDFFGDGYLVEGVGNEVIVVLTIFLGIASIALFLNLRTVNWTAPENVFGLREGVLSQTEIDQKIADARNRADQTCAVCLSPASFAIVQNCGHVFCFPCVHRYWLVRASPFNAITCASCRAKVTWMLPYNWPDPANAAPGEVEQNTGRLADYNRRFSGERTIFEYVEDLPAFWPFVLRSIAGYNILLMMFRVRMVLIFLAIFAYLLIPLDIFPENAYGLIGFVDDIFVVMLMLIYLAIAFRHFFLGRAEPHNN